MANKITDSAVRLFDGMKSVLTGLGGSVDANASAGWYMRPLSQHDIDACFRTSWLGRKVHQIPPTDMVRPWRKWLADPAQITAIEAEERRLGLRQKVRKALLWSRLYGGSAIIMGVDGDDPAQPLEVDRVRKGGLSYIHVLTRYELNVQAIDMDPGSRFYGEPLFYTVNGAGRSTQLHPSRVVRFVNGDLPDNVAFGEAGWSDPLLVSIRDALIHADGAQGHFAALPAKALTSTLTTPGLMGLVSTKAGEQQYIEKTRIAQAFKSMFNLNIVAGPARQGELGETWEDNQVSFANMAEAGTWFVQMVAGAADVPMTRLAGMSPGGMNSTGESDSANYWTMLDAGRELDLRPRMEMIDEVLLRSALGERPQSVWFDWLPFEVDTETTRAENAVKRANAIKTLADSQAVPSDVLEKIAKGQIIDSGDYPGAEEAYKEYDAAGEIEPLPNASEPENDNEVETAVNRLTAQGMTTQDAINEVRRVLDSLETE